MDKHLHIVTHDVPWPVDYGGVADLFYKIKSLHSLEVKIHLHCFTDKRPPQPLLENYCETVSYYPRKNNYSGFSFRTPYIVHSRRSEALRNAIIQNDYPILMEGIHCTYLLQKDELINRNVYVRLHNVEYKYYSKLCEHEKNIFKKFYFLLESRLLKKYEKSLGAKAKFLAVNKADVDLYKQELNATAVTFLPVFLPWQEIKCQRGKGYFCLYHGNLSVIENEKAAIWLIEHVFTDLKFPFVIAGKNPSSHLMNVAAGSSNIKIVANPGEDELSELIEQAQLHLLPSFNSTGIKLKLLNALFNGRHCLVNDAAVIGSGLEELCTVADTAKKFKDCATLLYQEVFTSEHISKRSSVLKAFYDNNKNANELLTLIW